MTAQWNAAVWAAPLLVALGGAAGAVLRWSALQFGKRYRPDRPVPTFVVNCIGSFALGLLSATAGGDRSAVLGFGVGLLGGFTTFSTFAVESVLLSRRANGIPGAILYISGTLTASAALAGAGWILGRIIYI